MADGQPLWPPSPDFLPSRKLSGDWTWTKQFDDQVNALIRRVDDTDRKLNHLMEDTSIWQEQVKEQMRHFQGRLQCWSDVEDNAQKNVEKALLEHKNVGKALLEQVISKAELEKAKKTLDSGIQTLRQSLCRETDIRKSWQHLHLVASQAHFMGRSERTQKLMEHLKWVARKGLYMEEDQNLHQSVFKHYGAAKKLDKMKDCYQIHYPGGSKTEKKLMNVSDILGLISYGEGKWITPGLEGCRIMTQNHGYIVTHSLDYARVILFALELCIHESHGTHMVLTKVPIIEGCVIATQTLQEYECENNLEACMNTDVEEQTVDLGATSTECGGLSYQCSQSSGVDSCDESGPPTPESGGVDSCDESGPPTPRLEAPSHNPRLEQTSNPPLEQTSSSWWNTDWFAPWQCFARVSDDLDGVPDSLVSFVEPAPSVGARPAA